MKFNVVKLFNWFNQEYLLTILLVFLYYSCFFNFTGVGSNFVNDVHANFDIKVILKTW